MIGRAELYDVHSMGTFAYIARDAAGQRITGRLTGASGPAVLAELQSRSLAPVEVREVRGRRRLRRTASMRELSSAYRQLADLLHAGVPLLRGLRLLGRHRSNPRLAAVFGDVAERVEDGATLGDAFGAHGEVFPSIHVAMIRAGERGAFLPAALRRLGDFLELSADLKAKVVGNMVYPAALLAVGAGVVVFAMTVLVPKFQDFYARIELPLATRILLGASNFLRHGWPFVVIAIAAAATLVWWIRQRPDTSGMRRAVAALQLRVPRLGPLVRDLAVARFARILGTLLDNGIPLLAALEISRDATGHPLLAEAVDRAADAVRSGETLAEPLGACGLLSEEAVEMISVGEAANSLPEVLIAFAETVEKRIDRVLTALVRLIEPVLLLLMAGMVFFIFMALVVPMLRMSASIS